MYNHVIGPEQYDPQRETRQVGVLSEALGAFSNAAAFGTHEQDKERSYEVTQF